MPILTKRIYDLAEPLDGYRLLTMRYWPRGVRKDRIDAWERSLAPTRELLANYRARTINWPEYERRYLHEMTTYPESIEALAALIRRCAHENVTALCGCKDETHCHRILLQGLVAASL